MKNFSIRLILLVLLVFVGPTIHEMVEGTKQKGHLSVPISDTEQSSFDDESEGSDGQPTCSFLDLFKHSKPSSQFTFQASNLYFSLADNIVLPPPQL